MIPYFLKNVLLYNLIETQKIQCSLMASLVEMPA